MNDADNSSRLPAELADFRDVHVLVIGDVMLDHTVSGATARVSPEAPVPVVAFEQERYTPGGAANVAVGVSALGARCTLLGVVGADAGADQLRALCTSAGVVSRLEQVDGAATAIKTRIVSRGQQLLRVDREQALPEAAAQRLVDLLPGLLDDVDVLLVSDYDKGAIADPGAVIEAARQRGVPVVVDPKLKPLAVWRGATLVKPNRAEFEQSAPAGGPRGEPTSGARLQAAARAAGIEHLLVTLGGDGVLLAGDTAFEHIAAHDVDVFDVTGAGDTVAAVLAVALAAGLPIGQAARLANLAGAVAVGHVGTVAVSRDQLAERLATVVGGPLGRVVELERLDAFLRQARERGERLVFTNGCFDLLHAGHVGYLAQAARLGDRLIVAVNDDASVRRLKGEGRPLNSVQDRAAVLAALAVVDWVVTFAEDTPHVLLERLRPDVLVKGGDYQLDQVVGAELVRGWGGEVRVLGHVDSPSTTDLISRSQT